ncbi:MAG: Gfo/Idh/MocA family oxidoreductase [Verrucomicrobia bacterium]|nr:Gfo/Idh/MocA family oxidoreductase [Verrucomicrobiota bacterium]
MSNQPMDRRDFVRSISAGPLAALAASAAAAESAKPEKKWQPVSDRKIRVGIVGYGTCRFGAAFGFQDHPNVQVVAVSDLFPDRCAALAKACRCAKTCESLEMLVKDPAIEAVFVATDAPSHARHCIEALNHGKHVMCAVPAAFGSIEEAAQLVETVKKTGLKYMMAETSYYRADCHAMRTIYRAGGLGRIVYSEGEYYHHSTSQIGSYKDWRVGLPPLWYPTHSTAYYVGVTGKRFTSVSCQGFRGTAAKYQPGGNRYKNPFADEIALFQTNEGGASRMLMAHSTQGLVSETGRVFGERGWFDASGYHGAEKKLPDMERPPLPPTMPPGGHGGSHGQLTHEFISAILEDRQPAVSIYEALAMTVGGIIAHQSALKGGESLKVPQFDPKA